MAYSYRRPAMVDNSINQFAIKLIALAPTFYILNAIWLFSNQ